jgi:hypothetical protein
MSSDLSVKQPPDYAPFTQGEATRKSHSALLLAATVTIQTLGALFLILAHFQLLPHSWSIITHFSTWGEISGYALLGLGFLLAATYSVRYCLIREQQDLVSGSSTTPRIAQQEPSAKTITTNSQIEELLITNENSLVTIKGKVYCTGWGLINENTSFFEIKNENDNVIQIGEDDFFLRLEGEFENSGNEKAILLYRDNNEFLLPSTLFENAEEGSIVRFYYNNNLIELVCEQNMTPSGSYKKPFSELFKEWKESARRLKPNPSSYTPSSSSLSMISVGNIFGKGCEVPDDYIE